MNAKCPFCGKKGISLWFKFAFMSEGRPKCEHCGNRPRMLRLVYVWDAIGGLLIIVALAPVVALPGLITFATLAAVFAFVIFIHCLFPFVKARRTRK